MGPKLVITVLAFKLVRDGAMPSAYTVLVSKYHDDVIKWKHFPRYWPFVRVFHRSRWIPHTEASDAELWYFLDLRLNKRLSKQPPGWWFETPLWSLWRQCNGLLCYDFSLATANVPSAIVWVCTFVSRNYPTMFNNVLQLLPIVFCQWHFAVLFGRQRQCEYNRVCWYFVIVWNNQSPQSDLSTQ